MKRLHQKIGVGVLVAGLLLGGVGFSGGSVAHANSDSQLQELLNGIKNEDDRGLLRKVYGIVESSGKYDIVDANEQKYFEGVYEYKELGEGKSISVYDFGNVLNGRNSIGLYRANVNGLYLVLAKYK